METILWASPAEPTASSSQDKRRPAPIPLDALPKANRAEVVDLPPGRGARRQLGDLGIFVGAVLRMERSAPLGGPVLVKVQGTLVALGRRLAHRVLVRVLP